MVKNHMVALCLILASNISYANDLQKVTHQVELLASLKQHYHSGCLFLIQPEEPGLRTSYLRYISTKLMSEKGIMTAIVSHYVLETSPINMIRCNQNRPVYALMSSENSTKTFVKEFRRIPMRSAIWLLFMEKGGSMDDFFKDIYVTFDSEFLVIRQDNEKALITEVYKVDELFPLQESLFGTWVARKGLTCSNATFYMRRNNLQGFTMLGITHETSQYTVLEDVPNGTLLKDGYFGFLWNEFQAGLNFKTNFTRHNSLHDPNARFTEMIALVQKDGLDVAVDCFPVNPGSNDAVDYTTPSHNARFRALIKPQGNTDMGISSYLGPFSPKLWCMIGITILVLAGCLALFHSLGRKLTQSEDFDGKLSYSFPISLFYVFGIFFQQGHDITPKSSGCRLVYWMSYLVSIVLLAAYSGTLISFLTVHRNSFPFTDLQGLLKDQNYKLGTMAKYYHYFTANKTSILYEVYKKKMMINKPITSYIEGLKQVCESNFVLWGSIDTTGIFMDNVACTILPIPNYGFDFNVAMVLSKNSPYRIFLDHKLAIMRDTGIMRREHQRSWYMRSPLEHNTWSSVSFDQVTPLLIILGFGLGFSICIVAVERLIAKLFSRPLNTIEHNTMTTQELDLHLVPFSQSYSYFNKNIKSPICTLVFPQLNKDVCN